jgi:hypothetical protein
MKIAVNLNCKRNKTLKIKSDKSTAIYKMFLRVSFCLTCLLTIGCDMPKITNPDNSEKFYELDKGFKSSNEVIEYGLRNTLDEMKNTLSIKPEFKPVESAAAMVPDIIKPLLDKINAIRVQIIEESGGLYSTMEHKSKWEGYGYKTFTIVTDKNMDGKAVGANNLKVPINVFIEKKKGAEIKESIIETRKELIKIIDDLVAELDKEPIVGFRLDPEAIRSLKKDLVIEVPDEKLWKKDGISSWEAYVFSNTSVAFCLPLLRKIENDAFITSTQIVNYLASNFGTKTLVYDKFDVFSQPKKGLILLGETFETEIALGAYSSQTDFSVSVNGTNVVVDNARAKYRFKPSSIGTQRYTATLNIKNPQTGQIETVKKEFEYEVVSPAK